MSIDTIINTALVVGVSGAVGLLVNSFFKIFSPDAVEIGAKIARYSVMAVEQISSKSPLNSDEKFSLAMNFFKTLAQKRGLFYTDEQIRILVESQVFEIRR